MKKGNLFENSVSPRNGMEVWGLDQILRRGRQVNVPVKGVIQNVFDIDNHGAGNTYVDMLLDDGQSIHLPLSRLFDHKPRYTKVTDMFGDTKVWQ